MFQRILLAALVLSAAPGLRAQAAAPPDMPATASLRADSLVLTYEGRPIFRGVVQSGGARVDVRMLADTVNDAVTQVIKFTASGGRVRVSGDVTASTQAFACEVDPAQDVVPMVRTASGPDANLLNRAVYDRARDWVISADFPAHVVVLPKAGADSTTFSLDAEGGEVAIRFRPRFYEMHRGLRAFHPWTYTAWRPSVAGWSSWYAFFDSVTGRDVEHTADVLSRVLKPFGYTYLQIDDGYQRTPVGPPANWLDANAKFPSGLGVVARDIAARGLQPAIWTNVAFHDSAYALAHPDEFVRNTAGAPAWGNWIGFVMDGANAATMRDLVVPVYDSLRRMGWTYFKVDALRHLRYEGYNSNADYFRARGLRRDSVYRSVVQTIRDVIGHASFLLACWGIRPELAGVVDAVRVGDDGFGYGGFAEYNSFNNVVWRNDPDHIQIAAADAYRATTLTSLTGSLLMLTDRPDVYLTDRAEAAKRAAPVLFTLPGQIYDVNPSRSSRIGEAAVTLSGAGPRPFDADKRPAASLYLLDVNRPFEHWSVLARIGDDTPRIRFSTLGLPADRSYLVYEFWTQHLLGAFRERFSPGAIDPRFQVQDFCIREALAHPQLVSTNRHVSCGGVDLHDVQWAADTLRGESDLVAGDDYVLVVHEPSGFRFVRAEATGAAVMSSAVRGGVRRVRLRSAGGGRVGWRIVYRGLPHGLPLGQPMGQPPSHFASQYENFIRKMSFDRWPKRFPMSPPKDWLPSNVVEASRPWLQTRNSVEPARYSQRNTTFERNCWKLNPPGSFATAVSAYGW